MNRSPGSTLWAAAAYGFAVLAFFNAAMLGNAWLGYVLQNPESLRDTWPTFSLALAGGNAALNAWLAGVGGAGLFAGSLALAVMQWQRSRRWPGARGVLTAMSLMAVCSALLGVVHYFHVAITLDVNNRVHMLFSYTFFFGMSAVIIVDLFCHLLLARRPATEAPVRLSRLHRAVGIGVLGDGAVFLASYLLKGVEANPWALETQRLFVVAELVWIALSHAYALCYMQVLRGHFRAGNEPHSEAPLGRQRA